jgi:hypothetical protein
VWRRIYTSLYPKAVAAGCRGRKTIRPPHTEPQLDRGGNDGTGAAQDALGVVTDEYRGYGQTQLVEEAGRRQPALETRTALGQHRTGPPFGHSVERDSDIDFVGTGQETPATFSATARLTAAPCRR